MPRVTSNNQTIAKNATLGLDHVVGPLSYTLPPSSTTPRSQPSQVVIESPVPVLLDVYADWCGPCKQLGPMLEEMAMRSGGMFRPGQGQLGQEPRGLGCVAGMFVCKCMHVGVYDVSLTSSIDQWTETIITTIPTGAGPPLRLRAAGRDGGRQLRGDPAAGAAPGMPT